jgi:hypothetical protein
MSIDWASINWSYVALLSGFTFIATLIANFVTFRHRLAAAILSTLCSPQSSCSQPIIPTASLYPR